MLGASKSRARLYRLGEEQNKRPNSSSTTPAWAGLHRGQILLSLDFACRFYYVTLDMLLTSLRLSFIYVMINNNLLNTRRLSKLIHENAQNHTRSHLTVFAVVTMITAPR